VERHKLSLAEGDLKYLNSEWYVSHYGLLRLAERSHCAGMHVWPVLKSSGAANSRWVFKAVVYKSRTCKRFVGYGDADLSNTSDLVRGAEMRVAADLSQQRARMRAFLGTSGQRARPCISVCDWISYLEVLQHPPGVDKYPITQDGIGQGFLAKRTGGTGTVFRWIFQSRK
jgi:hypothetical protein